MPNEIEIRFESKSYYDFVQKNSHPNPEYESVSAYLSLKKARVSTFDDRTGRR